MKKFILLLLIPLCGCSVLKNKTQFLSTGGLYTPDSTSCDCYIILDSTLRYVKTVKHTWK